MGKRWLCLLLLLHEGDCEGGKMGRYLRERVTRGRFLGLKTREKKKEFWAVGNEKLHD